MATGESSRSAMERITRHHLECSICQERYKQPKILSCGHSFCQDCLQKYRDSLYQDTSQIPCPICRRQTVLPQTGIPGLTANFHVIGMLEDVATLEKVARSDIEKLLCEACDEENEAKHRCLDCAQNLCLKCQKAHRQFRALSSHTIATLEDIRQGKVTIKRQNVVKCDKHMGQAMQFYCVTCNVLICQACTAVDHSKPEHQIMDSRKAAEKFKQSLNSQFPDLSKDVKGLQTTINETSEAKSVVNDKIAVARKAIQDKAAEVMSKVKAVEKRLLDELDITERDLNTRLDMYKKKLASLRQRKEHTLKTAKDAATKTSDSDFLCLYPVIQKDLEMLRTQHLPKLSGMHQYPVFTGKGVGDTDLGNLVLKATWKLLREFGKQGSGPGEFGGARGIAAFEPDKIAVADWNKERTVFYTHQGKITGSIPVASVDVASIPNQWVVANNDNVKVYNEDRTFSFEFETVPKGKVGKADVQVRSVAVKENGNFIVGDTKKKVLTEHNPTDGSLIRTMPVRITPDFLAVMDKDRIAVSSWDQVQVDVVDDNAATIFTIKPTIGGQPVKYCAGVCSNSSGIYAVVRGTEFVKSGHIHHYDSSGTFISCIIQDLYNPRGITFTAHGQQLAVADLHSVKIYHKV